MDSYFPTFEINGFIDDNFIEEFNDDLVYEYFDERYRDDPLIKVLNKDVVPDGFSRLGMFDLDDECFLLSRDTSEPVKYEIKPDYDPISIMFENFDKYNEGSRDSYVYVPVANPGVPQNKLFKHDLYNNLEEIMVSQDYMVLDPTPGQQTTVDEGAVSDYSDDMVGKHFDRYCLKINSKAAHRGAEIVGLEFNPFNPRSASLISAVEWESSTVCKGSYLLRGKSYRFRYDLMSKYFRYHSDVWMRKLKVPVSIRHHYQSYDMICLKRFLEDTPIVSFKEYELANNIFVEPIVTDRKIFRDYSVIGPWSGFVRRGCDNAALFVPYLTPAVSLRGIPIIERFRVLLPDEYSLSEVDFFDRVNDIRVPFKKCRFPAGDYFVQKFANENVYLVKDDAGDRQYVRLPFRLDNEFHNAKQSLVTHFASVSLLSMVYDCSKAIFEQHLDQPSWATINWESSDIKLYTGDVPDEIEQCMDVRLDRLVISRNTDEVPTIPAYKKDMRVQAVVEKTFDEKLASAMRNQSDVNTFPFKVNKGKVRFVKPYRKGFPAYVIEPVDRNFNPIGASAPGQYWLKYRVADAEYNVGGGKVDSYAVSGSEEISHLIDDHPLSGSVPFEVPQESADNMIFFEFGVKKEQRQDVEEKKRKD